MAEPAGDRSAAMLGGIQQTLELMYRSMLAQEKRLERLEEVLTRQITSMPQNVTMPTVFYYQSTFGHDDRTTGTQTSSVRPTNLQLMDMPLGALQGAPAIAPVEPLTHLSGATGPENSYHEEESPDISESIDTISYIEKSPLLDHPFVQEALGDAWMMPDDGRMPLSFSRDVLEELDIDKLRALVSYLGKFRKRITRSQDQQFYIMDYYGRGETVAYKLGGIATATRSSKSMELGSNSYRRMMIPRRRFIFCQGLNTTQQNDEDPSKLTVSAGLLQAAPFLLEKDRCQTVEFLTGPVQQHNMCYQRDRVINNYYRPYWKAFHIKFYEAPNTSIPDNSKKLPRGLWKYGSLYNSLELNFCESALTLIAIPSASERTLWRPEYNTMNPKREHKVFVVQSNLCVEWSILLLAPVGFFDHSFHGFPPEANDVKTVIGRETMEEAIIIILHLTYRRLRYTWRLFKAHFDELLDEGDALMKPDLHDTLLWDDESFSRCRKYAWTINCLTEFERSIDDNVLQWRNLKSSRLEPFLETGKLSPESVARLENIDNLCGALERLRRDFSDKLASTKALRDSLFSASTVIESRASTRLGENIRLLTFVSIFFLPLAFCTSLWSINDLFSSTALIYTTIIVGISTYIVVFHLNNLVHQASTIYTPVRDNMVSQMRNDGQEIWASRGNQFATFQPKHENQQPSEWWIFLFWARKLILLLSCRARRGPETVNQATHSSSEVLVIDCDDTTTQELVTSGAQDDVEKNRSLASQGMATDSNKALSPESLLEEMSGSRSSLFKFSFLRRYRPDRQSSTESAAESQDV